MEKKPYPKNDYKHKFPTEPILYPPLKKQFDPLDMDEDKYNEIGTIVKNLNKMNKQNLYKLLYTTDTLAQCGLKTGTKSVRNNYMKKLVLANEENFPPELGRDKLVKLQLPTNEEKLKKILDDVKSKTGGKKDKTQNNNLNGTNNAEVKPAKESKKKRKNSFIVDDVDVVNTPDKPKPKQGEEEFDKQGDEEMESEKEEAEDEQSYENEDDYNKANDDEGYGDDDGDNDNFSDGGVI